MKRVRAAFGLLAFLAVLIVASSILVQATNDALLNDLDRIGAFNAAGDYEAALEVIEGMNSFFSRREHWMALFIKRDYLSGIAMGCRPMLARITNRTCRASLEKRARRS